jgi:BirA family transcriptional regulator, biotin operon repressor / biotin---[acetyl-CoA-carboxylase] ligase
LLAASINNVVGQRFIELLRVDSTNNYAMQQAQKGMAFHGDAYFAFEQTSGKGQFDKKWLSAKGENIILSLVLDTSHQLLLSQQFVLNMAAALTVMRLFNKYTTEKVKIKWPNDIYCRDRKAAGILTENVIRGTKWQFAIAGFGININQTSFPPGLKNAVSLKQITGNTYNAVELAKEFCSLFDENFKHLLSGNEKHILDTYNDALYKRYEKATFKHGATNFSGIVKGVDIFGRLNIENGNEQAFETGQLEWIL